MKKKNGDEIAQQISGLMPHCIKYITFSLIHYT